ncbi:MAG: TIGR03619 family F420-dependent LLM class oxidoreductase [Acidimicrobiales bacterium]
MRFWQAVAFLETDQVLELARVADEAGYHGIMVSDHLFFPADLRSAYPYSDDGRPFWSADTPWPDPWVLIGAMAAVTTRLRFTTNVYVAPARNPFVVAKAVSTAAVLSGGRVALGVGAGWMREEFDQLGQDFSNRGRRLDEMIELLRLLWRGGMQEYHGTWYDFEPLQISPVPPQPIPIWCGGQSDPAMRRAARADGWIGNAYSPEGALEQLNRLKGFRASAGTLDRPDFEVVVGLLSPPSVDLYRRMEDAGATSLICAPWMAAAGGAATARVPLAARRAAVERFADSIIARMT